MAPVELGASHFSPDIRAFIELLHAHRVRYLIVGGEAVIFHGHVRLTGDVDFFFSREEANVNRLFAALEEFWDGDVPGLNDAQELVDADAVIQFGVPPNRIDLMSDIKDVDFEEAWRGRVECRLVTDGGKVPLPFIGLDELVENKRATGRPKDLDDLDYLTRGR